MTVKIRLMIADDHQMFSDGLVSIFQHDEDVQIVGIASNGIELMRLLEQKQADLVLMDLSMPHMNGEEASKEILNRYPAMKIIVLTMHHTPDIVLPLIDSGVHGCMLKNSGKSELKT
ncbi:MAG: response regulator, partial [Bacteroidia bacterium]